MAFVQTGIDGDDVLLSQIEIPDYLRRRVNTGITELNSMLVADGQGWVPSGVTLITGGPGSGKTTLSLQIAGYMAKNDAVSLYNNTEMDEALLALYAERSDIEGIDALRVSAKNEVGEILSHATRLRKANADKDFFMVIDSLQTIGEAREEGKRGRDKSQENQAYDSAKTIYAWAKEHQAMVMLIGHVTKDGKFAGKKGLQHVLDAHLHLAKDTNKKSLHFGERFAKMEKNRFGGGGTSYYYEVGAHGFTFTGDVDVETE